MTTLFPGGEVPRSDPGLHDQAGVLQVAQDRLHLEEVQREEVQSGDSVQEEAATSLRTW